MPNERSQPNLLRAAASGVAAATAPSLPHHAADLGDDRCLLDPEPQRDEAQHAREDHRVAHAQQHARREPHPGALPANANHNLSDRDERQPDEQESARAEAVQEDAHGDLHAGIHDEPDHRERREPATP